MVVLMAASKVEQWVYEMAGHSEELKAVEKVGESVFSQVVMMGKY